VHHKYQCSMCNQIEITHLPLNFHHHRFGGVRSGSAVDRKVRNWPVTKCVTGAQQPVTRCATVVTNCATDCPVESSPASSPGGVRPYI
jgi:hypothetical protein